MQFPSKSFLLRIHTAIKKSLTSVKKVAIWEFVKENEIATVLEDVFHRNQDFSKIKYIMRYSSP